MSIHLPLHWRKVLSLSLAALGLGALPSSAIVTITPDFPVSSVGFSPGHFVEFRKAASNTIFSQGNPVNGIINLFTLAPADSNVIAIGIDDGVSVINYVDTGGGNDFANPRDIGASTLTMVKTTTDTNPIGTFFSQATDNEFGMKSSGYIFIPAGGFWTFTVKSDDGCRLLMGKENAVVMRDDFQRGPSYTGSTGGNPGDSGVADSVVSIPGPGYYHYELIFEQGGGGAMVQFAGAAGSFPEPTSGGFGALPQGSHLVGDTANGGLAVYRKVNPVGLQAATGDQVPTEKAGTVFSSFGVASLDDGTPAFLASIKPQTFSPRQAIMMDPTLALVHQGDPAPGVSGAAFATFQNPVFGGGHCAFIATMATGFAGVTKTNATGIWSSAFGPVALVARVGSAAPGIAGATFQSFVSLVLPSSGGSAFVAKLAGIPSNKSLSLWRETSTGPVVVLRQGDSINLGFGPRRVVSSFVALSGVSGSPDQRRFSSNGEIPVRITCTDGAQVLAALPGNGGALTLTTFTGDGPDLPDGTEFKTFGIPGDSGAGTAFLGTLLKKVGGVTAQNANGVFVATSGTINAIARQGDSAPGTTGKFLSFSDPALAGTSTVAFMAKLAVGGGVTAANAAGIWSNATGSLQLVAQQGGSVPDVPEAQFSAFTSVALPDDAPAHGPVYLAKLANGAGGVTNTNNVGLWSTDAAGVGHLVVRMGDSVAVHSAMKTVKAIHVLGIVAGSPGQPRALGATGVLVYSLDFTDRKQAVFATLLP